MQGKITCPVCGHAVCNSIIVLEKFPVSNLELASSVEDAMNAEVYDMHICMCEQCTHIYNNIPVQIEYGRKKNVTYFTNNKQREHVIHFSHDLIEKYHIRNKRILEIGSGDGLFLKELASANNCTGYEPSLRQPVHAENLKIINDYFHPDDVAVDDVDWIVMRHVLEHFENPYAFLRSIVQQSIRQDSKIKFVLEVPNVNPTLDDLRINDFIHEHISHFSFYSMQYLLNRLNLDILDMYGTDHDENIVAICQVKHQYRHNRMEAEKLSALFHKSVEKIQQDYQDILSKKQYVCIWGAEGRGAGFIKTIKDFLRGDEMIVDSDNRKFQKYIPSIGLKITGYKELIGKKIDAIIITTAVGKNNILKEIKENNINVEDIYLITENGLDKVT